MAHPVAIVGRDLSRGVHAAQGHTRGEARRGAGMGVELGGSGRVKIQWRPTRPWGPGAKEAPSRDVDDEAGEHQRAVSVLHEAEVHDEDLGGGRGVSTDARLGQRAVCKTCSGRKCADTLCNSQVRSRERFIGAYSRCESGRGRSINARSAEAGGAGLHGRSPAGWPSSAPPGRQAWALAPPIIALPSHGSGGAAGASNVWMHAERPGMSIPFDEGILPFGLLGARVLGWQRPPRLRGKRRARQQRGEVCLSGILPLGAGIRLVDVATRQREDDRSFAGPGGVAQLARPSSSSALGGRAVLGAAARHCAQRDKPTERGVTGCRDHCAYRIGLDIGLLGYACHTERV
eukprot:scaffold30156_cov65-Phaeocystis_antarctica.AAC.2